MSGIHTNSDDKRIFLMSLYCAGSQRKYSSVHFWNQINIKPWGTVDEKHNIYNPIFNPILFSTGDCELSPSDAAWQGSFDKEQTNKKQKQNKTIQLNKYK